MTRVKSILRLRVSQEIVWTPDLEFCANGEEICWRTALQQRSNNLTTATLKRLYLPGNLFCNLSFKGTTSKGLYSGKDSLIVSVLTQLFPCNPAVANLLARLKIL